MSRVEQQAKRIRELLDQNQRLTDHIAALEEALLGDVELPILEGLTRQQGMLLALLLRRDMATKEQLHAVLYAGRPDNAPELKIIDVMICNIRRKIAGLGIEIETIWGVGYRITKGRDVLRAKQKEAA